MEFMGIGARLRARLPEFLILGAMALLLWSNLSLLLDINVWRNDSMYYVNTYDDKLAQEGRWVNHLFFRFLQLVPSQVAILLSYFSVIAFSGVVAYRVTNNYFFAAVFGILCVLTPVLAVQLEWPETLLIGFLLLALAPVLQKNLSDHYFFLITAILFLGTFSAFYFLMPLLFLKDLQFSRAWRLILIWIMAFLVGYMFTNILVYALTGDRIQVASWRNPSYVHSFDDLIGNLEKIYQAFRIHLEKMQSFLKPGALVALILVGLLVAVKTKQLWGLAVALVCSLGIYFSTLPIGIYIQDRTTLSAFVALFAALFVFPYATRKASLLVMAIMFLLASRTAMVGHEGIDWYKTHVTLLTNQIRSAVSLPPEEVGRVFVVADMAESEKLFEKIGRNIDKENLYSEGFSHPQYWIPALKELGYTQFRVCANLEGWDCDQIKSIYAERAQYQREQGVFISRSLPSGDIVLMINPAAIR